jgi:hypothetical protein
LASAALVLTALVLRVLDRREPPAAAVREEAPVPLDGSGTRAAWVLFGVGTSSALAFRFLTNGLPRAGAGPGATAAAITTAFFLGMAVTAIPVGRLALGRIGGGPVTVAGLCLLVAGAPLLLVVDGAAAVLLVVAVQGAALAALQNGLFAWSLVAVRAERAGLGMGLLLGAGGLALGLFNFLLAVRKPAPGTSLLAAAGLYALTLVLLAALRRTVRAPSPG